MNTKLIMTVSAIFLAAIGITLSFAPESFTSLMGIANSSILQILTQLLGAMYCGFAILNWMAKGAIIGGIYNRPISIANLLHFFAGAAALVKFVIKNHQAPLVIMVITGCYCVFAVIFWIIFSTHPSSKNTSA